MHTQDFNPPNGAIFVFGFVSYNDLRATAVSLRAIALISRDESMELYDYEPTSTGQDVGDGAFIKPNSIDHADPGRWVRKPTFGSGGGGTGDHGELDGLEDDDHPQYTTEAEVLDLIADALSAVEVKWATLLRKTD